MISVFGSIWKWDNLFFVVLKHIVKIGLDTNPYAQL